MPEVNHLRQRITKEGGLIPEAVREAKAIILHMTDTMTQSSATNDFLMAAIQYNNLPDLPTYFYRNPLKLIEEVSALKQAGIEPTPILVILDVNLKKIPITFGESPELMVYKKEFGGILLAQTLNQMEIPGLETVFMTVDEAGARSHLSKMVQDARAAAKDPNLGIKELLGGRKPLGVLDSINATEFISLVLKFYQDSIAAGSES